MRSFKQVAAVLCLLALITFGCCSTRPLVKIENGMVGGFLKKSYNGRTFSAFEGIPYAKPPIGKLRFSEPQAAESWDGILEANTTITCMQSMQFGTVMQNVIMGEEDCLHLNVYVPREETKSTDNFDVVVHIHGGAFMMGTPRYTGPNYIMDRDVVYMTMNYRVGILGFLSTEDSVVPGNNGLKDQTLALKWLQKNIKRFGGNPNSITLTGLSAGGASVHYHYLSPLSKGLFHRGLSQSGAVTQPWTFMEKPLEKARLIGASVGCTQKATEDLVSCMKQRTARQIVENTKNLFGWLYNPFSPLGVTVERQTKNPFLADHPYNMLIQGKANDVPWITSVTKDEGLFPSIFYYDDNILKELDDKWLDIAPHLLDYDHTVNKLERDEVSRKIKDHYFKGRPLSKETFKELVAVTGDRHFIVDSENAARIQAKFAKSPVYFYKFSYAEGEHSLTKHLLPDSDINFGVSHGDDTFYTYYDSVFSKLSRMNKQDEEMKEIFLDMLVSYAKTGVPKIRNADWKPLDSGASLKNDFKYLNIRSPTDIKMDTSKHIGEVEFWNALPIMENKNIVISRDEL